MKKKKIAAAAAAAAPPEAEEDDAVGADTNIDVPTPVVAAAPTTTIQSVKKSRAYFANQRDIEKAKNDTLQKTVTSLAVDVEKADGVIAKQQQKHERDIEKRDDLIDKAREAKRRKQSEASEDSHKHSEEMKRTIEELKRYKLIAKEATINKEKAEKETEKMRKENDDIKEKWEALIASHRDELKQEKELTDKAKLEGKATLRAKEKEYSDVMEKNAEREKKRRDEVKRHAAEETAEASNKMATAREDSRAAQSMKSKAEALEKEAIVKERFVLQRNATIQYDQCAKIEELECELRRCKELLEDKQSLSKQYVLKKEKLPSGHEAWGRNIMQLVMELLVNGVPSRSINKSLLSFIHLMTNGDTDYTIEELPSVWYIRRVRTMLLTVTQVLAAYRLGKAKKWGQLHTDMTSRRQVHFLDLLLSYSDGDSDNEHEYKTVLMSCCIFPEDETAKQQIESIDNFLKEQGALLEEWKLVIEKMYPDYVHDIPDAASLDLGKLADGGVVTTDTCNSAKSVMRMMIELIIERGKNNDTMLTVLESVVEEVANGEVDAADNDGEQINVEERRNVLAGFCQHHIRCVWWKNVNARLSSFLREKLSGDLSLIDSKWRVEPNMNSICYAVYRCFSLNCNYAKGVGEDFQYWRNINHPGSLLVALSRLSGSREDAILEGATAIFWNRWMYIAYLEELLGTPGCDNLLFDNMAIILRSEEICALCRVCAILHYSISMPMRWLAAKTQALAEYNWSIRSMGRAIDLVFTAVRKIKDDGSLLLNSDFMNSIFDVLRTVRADCTIVCHYYYCVYSNIAILH